MSLLNLFFIALALSMDTFSLSLSLSLMSNSLKFYLLYPLLVAIFHFTFPIIGSIIGNKILSFLIISSNKLLGLIFIFLFIKLYFDMQKDADFQFKLTFFPILTMGILVSLDSLITGFGLAYVIKSSLLPSLIFAMVSGTFTFLGLKLGSTAQKNLGTKANNIGLILLLLLGIIHLCK
jgi:manganese efflux pump family protein